MTVTLTVPTEAAGLVAVIEVEESAVTAAALVPNFTLVAPERLLPMMVTEVPPACGPAPGLTPVTIGAGTYVKVALGVTGDEPAGVVTVTLTFPVSAGVTAVTEVAETSVTFVPMAEPKSTAVAPVRFLPFKVTVV